MKFPYALLSDQHCHAWSTFATITPEGVNSRLEMILSEMVRAAVEVKAAGGDTMIFAGDLFHQRGAVDPEVFNPTQVAIRRILELGVKIYAIPGNHDLKSKETTEIGNAIQTFGDLTGFTVLTTPWVGRGFAMVPWRHTHSQLHDDLQKLADELDTRKGLFDVIIHAGVDGVLNGTPDSGLTAASLAAYGFKRVFAGHYHDFKEMEDGKVVSIGATTHQTWRDVGSKAGFLLVSETSINRRGSRAPEFIDITDETDPESLDLIVDQNYVRVRGAKLTGAQVREMRELLFGLGAAGISIEVPPEEVLSRAGGSSKPETATLEESVHNYIKALELDYEPRVRAAANDILSGIKSEAV